MTLFHLLLFEAACMPGLILSLVVERWVPGFMHMGSIVIVLSGLCLTWPLLRLCGFRPIFVTCPHCGEAPGGFGTGSMATGIILMCPKCQEASFLLGEWIERRGSLRFRFDARVTTILLDRQGREIEARAARWPRILVFWKPYDLSLAQKRQRLSAQTEL